MGYPAVCGTAVQVLPSADLQTLLAGFLVGSAPITHSAFLNTTRRESMSDVAESPETVHLLEATVGLPVPEFTYDRR